MPIPPEWDPNAENNSFNFPNKDINGDTEAIRLAKKGIIPDIKKYYHNPNVVDNNGHTISYYLWNQEYLFQKNGRIINIKILNFKRMKMEIILLWR